MVHSPGAVDSAHERHKPLQSVEQHTPCEQKLLSHWLGLLQAPPRPARPHWPTPLHIAGDWQPLFIVVHMVAQSLPSAAQA